MKLGFLLSRVMLIMILSSPVIQSESVTITWTCPGDDKNVGTATAFDLRYSFEFINATNWHLAVPVTELPDPEPAGTVQSVVINGFDSSKVYYFAMRAVDEAGNWSVISNVVYTARCENDCIGIRGNVNGDDEQRVNIADIQFLVDYLFGIPNGPRPACEGEANVNGDENGYINIGDVNYLVSYLFGIPSGPFPPPCN